eukprot:COSAG02_NODE_22492_length_750_cov_1.490015_2_plen_23_part_01
MLISTGLGSIPITIMDTIVPIEL